ncbi:hypothetical protein Bca101_070530 [Brassica carinata]
MKPFNSNLVKANEAETSDTDHLEHILGKHWVKRGLVSPGDADVGINRLLWEWTFPCIEEYPLSKLIDVYIPISLIPKPLYEKSIDFINTLPFDTLPAFVLWSSDLILTEWPEVVKVEQRNSNKSKVATFVVLAMALPGGQGNPALANGATAIAISVLTQNVDCFKQWDVLYKENLEASVALLNKLVDEWKDHSLKLSSSSSDTLTVKHAMNSFRMKSCKLISRRLSRGIGIAPLTAMVIAAAGGVVGAGAAHALIYLARSKKSFS